MLNESAATGQAETHLPHVVHESSITGSTVQSKHRLASCNAGSAADADPLNDESGGATCAADGSVRLASIARSLRSPSQCSTSTHADDSLVRTGVPVTAE